MVPCGSVKSGLFSPAAGPRVGHQISAVSLPGRLYGAGMQRNRMAQEPHSTGRNFAARQFADDQLYLPHRQTKLGHF